MAIFTSDLGENVLEDFDLYHQSIPINLTVPYKKSVMFQDWPKDDIDFIKTHNFSYNAHSFAVSPDRFASDKGLSSFWDVTSVSEMPNNGTLFVSSIEAKEYPILATQFHPEKVAYIWS